MIRQPAVAGTFYPQSREQLGLELERLITAASPARLRPKAIIAPHAGYRYSGPIAASGYRSLQSLRRQIHRVVLLGPSHRVPFEGIAAPSFSHYQTPLGEIAIDHAALEPLYTLAAVNRFDAPHLPEHSLEVQLPFLQYLLEAFTLVPLVVGSTSPHVVHEVLSQQQGGEETLIVISSDLSHYLPYPQAQRLDRKTSHAIETLDDTGLGYDSACGRVPIGGLLLLAQQQQWQCHTVDLRNSGDTAGDHQRVVGYGSYLFTTATPHTTPLSQP